MGRRVGLAFLGWLVGGIFGCGAGLLGGLAYTEMAATSGFEGYSGFVIGFWMLGGIAVGMIAGLIAGITWSRRRAK